MLVPPFNPREKQLMFSLQASVPQNAKRKHITHGMVRGAKKCQEVSFLQSDPADQFVDRMSLLDFVCVRCALSNVQGSLV